MEEHTDKAGMARGCARPDAHSHPCCGKDDLESNSITRAYLGGKIGRLNLVVQSTDRGRSTHRRSTK